MSLVPDFNPSLTLEELIPFEILRPIMWDFGELTGLRVTLADYKGRMIEELENPNTVNSCAAIRALPIGYKCEKCDAYAGLEAARLNHPIVYLCHMGCTDMAAPIIVGGQYMGSLLAGQVLLTKEESDTLEYIIPPTSTENLPPEAQAAVRHHKKLLRLCSLEKLKIASRLLYNIANYMSELSYTRIMQERINKYEMDLLKAKNDAIELERALAASQLKNMQEQMNPHFLFNALNTISHQALLEGDNKTPYLVAALSDILRSTLKTGSQVTTLGDEINYVKSYLCIMQASLQERLTVSYDIDESCLDMALPLLTIQPLIENAVNHGIGPKPEGGSLSISCVLKDRRRRVAITIVDTGVGMSPEMLTQLYSLRKSRQKAFQGKDSPLGIGIKNAVYILSQHFGEEFSWNVSSTQGTGSCFTLSFPYLPIDTGEH